MAQRYVDVLSKAGTANIYAATTAAECQQLCADHQPHILHLHGGSEPFTLPAGLRLVVTPHGQQPGPLRAFAVIARSPHEAEALRQQFPRVETILNPLITRTISPEECARQMDTVYQRVMHTNIMQLMDDDTRRLLYTALAADTYGDTRWLPQPLPTSATDTAMTYILLYATVEGILPNVQRGLRMLGMATTDEAPTFDGYLPQNYRTPQPMPVATISELLSDIATNGPTLIRMAEIARALHSENLDEALLVEQLDADRQLPLLTALLPLLAEQLLLTEGFMPEITTRTPQLAGIAATTQLRNQLMQHQMI